MDLDETVEKCASVCLGLLKAWAMYRYFSLCMCVRLFCLCGTAFHVKLCPPYHRLSCISKILFLCVIVFHLSVESSKLR